MLNDICHITDGMDIKTVEGEKIPAKQYRISIMDWNDGKVKYTISDDNREFEIFEEELEKRAPVIETVITRENGKTKMKFSIPKEVEKMFKTGSEVKTSDKWEGLRFYYQADIQGHPSYSKLLADNKLRDNYGSTIMEDNRFNIAFLRTVGGKGEVEIEPSIPMAVWSEKLNELAGFIKLLMQEYYLKNEVRACITVVK